MEDMAGNAKGAEQLIGEVAGKWGELSEAQQRNTAVGVAGIYQLSRWNALMLNYNMAMSAATTAANSYGSAMREQETYNQSLEARINRMQTAWYGLADALSSTIGYDAIVVFTNVLEYAAGAGEGLSKVAIGLSSVLGVTLAGSLMFVNKSFRAFAMQGAATTATMIANRTAGTALAGAMTSLATSTGIAATAMRGLLAAVGIGLAIGVLTLVIGKLTSAYSDNIQAQEELDNMMQKNVDALTVNKEKVDELMNSYTALVDKKNSGWLSTEEEEKLLNVQNQLAELYPSLIDHIDRNGNAHLKSTDGINATIASTEKLIEAERKLKRESAEDNFGDMLKSMEKVRKERDRLQGILDGFSGTASTKELAKIELQIQKLDMELADSSASMANSIIEISDAFVETGTKIDDTINTQIRDAIESLDFSELDASELEDFAKKLADIRVELSSALGSGDSSGFATAREALASLVEEMSNGDASISSSVLNFNNLSKAAEASAESLQFADDSMDGTGESADVLSEKIADLMEEMEKLDSVQEKLAGVSEGTVQSSQELLFMYEQLTYRLQGYTDAQLQDLLTKPKLTSEEKLVAQAMKERADVITLLSTLYPQYAKLQENAISLSAEQVTAMKMEEEANKVLLEAYKLASEGKLTAEQEMTLASVGGTKARIEALKGEIKALEAMQQASVLAAQSAISMLPNGNIVGQALSEQITRAANSQISDIINSKVADIESIQGSLNSTISGVKSFVETAKKADSAVKGTSKSTTDATKSSIYIADKYKQKMDELALAIEKVQILQNKYAPYSASYRKAIQEEIKLQQEKLKAINDQTAALQKQIKSGKIQQTGMITTETASTQNTKTTTTQSVSSGGAWTGRLTSAQGNRTIGGKTEYHRGIDLASPAGTQLVANIAGKVLASGEATKFGYHESYGNLVVVQDDSGMKHLYAHLQKTVAKVGEYVQKGAQLGNVGSTGRSTGSHLHYEVRNQANVAQDAASYAKEARSGTLSISAQVANTTKAIADTQQDIDNAKSTVLDLQGEALQQQQLIEELMQKIVESTIAWYDYRRDVFDQNLSHETAKLKTLDKESARYTKTLDLMAQYMNQKQAVNQEELNYLDGLIAKGGQSEVVMNQLKDRQLELKTAMHELNDEIQKFNLDRVTEQYEDAYRSIENLRNLEEAKLEHLNTSSQRYSQTLLGLADSYQKQADTVEENIKALNGLISAGKLTGDNLKEAKQQVSDLTVELEDLYLQIMSKNYEVIVNIKTQYDDTIDDNQFEIDRSKAIQALYEEGTGDYNNEINKQIGLYEKQISLYDESRRKLQAEMKQANLTSEQKKELMEQMEDLSLSYWNAIGAVDSLTKAMEESDKRMREQIADAYINAYKEYVREIQEEHMKMLEDQESAETDAYNKRKKMLDDELDLFRKNVEEKLKMIDRLEDARTYQMELDDLESERKDLVKVLNLLSIDNSYEAKKKRKQLNEQLDELDKQITEHKHQRDIELQKQALNDMLDLKEEELQGKQEINDKEYNNLVASLARQKEYWTKHYNDLANDERKFAQIREDIMAGHFDKVNAEFEGMISQLESTMPRLADTMDGTMAAVGTAIRQNVIDQLREAMKMVDEYQAKASQVTNKWQDNFNPNEGKSDLPASTSPSDTSSGNTGSGDLIRGVGDIKVVVGKYMTDILANKESNPTRAANIREKAHALAAQGRAEGSTIPVNQHVDSSLSGFSKQDKENIKDYVYGNAGSILQTGYLQDMMRSWAASLDTGGYLNFSGSGIDGKGGKAIIAHDGEVILNKVQTNRLLDNIEVSDSLMSKVMNMASSFSNWMSGGNNELAVSGGINIGNISFGDIYGATEDQANDFAGQFIDIVNTRKGGFYGGVRK